MKGQNPQEVQKRYNASSMMCSGRFLYGYNYKSYKIKKLKYFAQLITALTTARNAVNGNLCFNATS